ncbi:MAG: hypothetical protein JWQ71_357 [Pedosphaera sp.]|nr:hypothetical protein [Pedosphaera sp.]
MRAFLKVSYVALLLWLSGVPDSYASEQSKTIPLAQVPPVAQKTILAKVGEGKLGDVDQVTEDAGEISYDIEVTGKDGVERSFNVTPDGKLQSWQVFITELPEAVQKTIEKQKGKGKLEEIYKDFEAGEFTYEVSAKHRNGKEYSFTVGVDGKLISVEMELGQTPKVVQKAIRTQVADGKVSRIDKYLDDEEVTFDVEAEKGGKAISFSLTPDGKLVED